MRKYTTVKKNISMYNAHRVVDRDPSNPDFQTISSMYQVKEENGCFLRSNPDDPLSFVVVSTIRNGPRSG